MSRRLTLLTATAFSLLAAASSPQPAEAQHPSSAMRRPGYTAPMPRYHSQGRQAYRPSRSYSRQSSPSQNRPRTAPQCRNAPSLARGSSPSQRQRMAPGTTRIGYDDKATKGVAGTRLPRGPQGTTRTLPLPKPSDIPAAVRPYQVPSSMLTLHPIRPTPGWPKGVTPPPAGPMLRQGLRDASSVAKEGLRDVGPIAKEASRMWSKDPRIMLLRGAFGSSVAQ